MKCDCCSKKKGLLEAYEIINYEGKRINLCANCCKLIYKIRDATKENSKQVIDEIGKKVENFNDKSSDDFKNWYGKAIHVNKN